MKTSSITNSRKASFIAGIGLLTLLFATPASFSPVAFAQQPPNDPPCPNSELAPEGLAPAAGGHCDGTGCLVNFNNYKWWTAFTYNPGGGYYYNGGLGTSFAPEHVFLDGRGDMHLRMAKDWNNNTEWAGAEAVLMFRADGTQANLGYGDYLVTAEIVKPANQTFATYDPNVALGMFTYERVLHQPSPFPNNPNREIDLAEISRWGWNHVTPAACPFMGSIGFFDKMTLCQENAQFALQVYTEHTGMVKRYDIGHTNKITLVMRWRAGQVTYEKYNGIHKLNNLPTQEKFAWTTPPELAPFVPTPGCSRFHINLWLGNFYDTNWNPWVDPNHPHAGPTDGNEVEVVIRNFEFQQPTPTPMPRAHGHR